MTDELYFKYQPRYYHGEISSYEALLRSHIDNFNVEAFVYSIKCSASFDLNIILKVLQERKSLHICDDVSISLNISIASLLDDNFMSQCLEIFENEKNITLELTNHDQTNDFHGLNSSILRLKNRGVKFALDDYGKGYLNTDDFLYLDVDYIKLDRKLIRNINTNYITYSVLKAKYNHIINVLGKIVIIEGIETFEQFNLVKEFGDMLYQGFYFSKPIDITEIRQIKKREFPQVNNKKQFSLNLDEAIFDLNRTQKPKDIQQAIDNIKKIDKYNIIGLTPNTFDLHSERQRINQNYREIIKNKTRSHFLLASSLVCGSDGAVIIRDKEGNAIFNNEHFVNYIGIDLVDVSVEEACEQITDYRTCLNIDNELLLGDSCFMMSDEVIETKNGSELVHIYRQKVSHFDQYFIICSVYEAADTIIVDELTTCYQKNYLYSTYMNQYKILVFIDLDGFKDINDSFGHYVGDEVLRDFSLTIKNMLRDEDVIIRFGGDEFVILLNSHVIKNVHQRIEQLRQNIEWYFNRKETQLSFSYGVASLQDGVELALKAADEAMYKQKFLRKQKHSVKQ
ncbi:GGDEF domain-containing protein [Photobacterium phosphoreum]|uniref:GGDEF domain-containing protein n=1 Tax=Photobacterium phosphoreum TaxID=659 RepID=UPI000D15CFA2|nr:GGDEF domain-containing protein [Photobacterium phosphoreum]PSU58796.1 GGDEF domain-containing protein [Photobacterium phosphoreum]